jgi:hypothetical protein
MRRARRGEIIFARRHGRSTDLGWVLILLGVIQLAGGFSLIAGNTFRGSRPPPARLAAAVR